MFVHMCNTYMEYSYKTSVVFDVDIVITLLEEKEHLSVNEYT